MLLKTSNIFHNGLLTITRIIKTPLNIPIASITACFMQLRQDAETFKNMDLAIHAKILPKENPASTLKGKGIVKVVPNIRSREF